MSGNFCCWFCNQNGQGSLLGMIYNPIGNKIEYFRHNRSCEICRDSLKKNNMNFSSSKFTAIREDVMKCLCDPQFFIPAIDKILLPRFAKMFDGFEQYSFAFSSKKALDLLEPMQLLDAKEIVVFLANRYIPDVENSNILVTHNFEVRDIRLNQEITKYLYQKLFDSISSKQLFIKSKIIELCELQITAEIFLVVAKDMIIDEENEFISYFGNQNILVTEKFVVKNVYLKTTKNFHFNLMDSIFSKQLLIKAKIIELCELQISSEIFCLLLSPQLVELKCVSFELTTLLNPVDFIEKIPNIEKFLFTDNKNDEFKTLPINCKGLEKFCRPLKSLNLSVKSFSDIIKKWSRNQKKIFICTFDSENKFLNFPIDAQNQALYDF